MLTPNAPRPAFDAPSLVPPSPSRVLVVDDNEANRFAVGYWLRDAGYAVLEAETGEEAIARLDDRPDLVILDIRLPDTSGFDVLRRIRERSDSATLPVVHLTASFVTGEWRAHGLDSGADAYLTHPIEPRELVATVRALLRVRAAEVERERLLAEVQGAYAEAESARAYLGQIFEQAPVVISTFRGPTHVFTAANALFRRVTGKTPEIVGRPVREVQPELAASGAFELLDRVYATGEPYVGTEMAVPRPDEEDEAFFNFVYQPVLDEHGAVTGIISIATDVTELVRARRRAEALRADAERERAAAEAANRAKSDFLANMSHELRTPLNAIAGYVQLLDMGLHGPVTEPQRESLGRVTRAQQHLLGLINDVLNLAKLDAGRVEYDLAAVDVAAVVRDVVLMIEPQAVGKGLELGVAAEAAAVAWADREKTTQVLLNLLSNAVKFTPAGGRVTVAAALEGDQVVLHVSDTGVGIPRDQQERIFEPFVQVRSGLTREHEGTGLGLAISRDLARGMGGDLRVESTEGEGSSFILSLPPAPAGARIG